MLRLCIEIRKIFFLVKIALTSAVSEALSEITVPWIFGCFVEKIAQEIYHASEVVADTKVRQQLKDFETKGFGKLPVCIAKTQYSFSTDPNLKGAPTGHVLPIER